MHRKNTFEPPSDLETYVFFEIPVDEVHVDGLEAHVDARKQALHSIQATGTTRRRRRSPPAATGHEMS